MSVSLTMLGNPANLNVGCTAFFKVTGAAVGDTMRVNGSTFATVNADPYYTAYSSALTGTDTVTVRSVIPPNAILATLTFNWAYALLCPDLGPSDPVLTAAADYDSITLDWTASSEFDPTWPTPITSYTLDRSLIPFTTLYDDAVDRTWTLNPTDPLEIVDLASEAEGPKPGVRYWYRVIANPFSTFGSGRSNQEEAQLLAGAVAVDAVAYRIAGDEIVASGGSSSLPELPAVGTTAVGGDGVDVSRVRWRIT